LPGAVAARQCCRDHLKGGQAGHVACLERLQEAGRFLPLDSPDRESAGEARRAQVWEAAIEACKAGHAHLLTWLFRSGWPRKADVFVPDDVPDVIADWNLLKSLNPEVPPPLAELALYSYAVTQPCPACLAALLDAGCRSEWLCTVAALKERQDSLSLSASRGCPVMTHTVIVAAHTGQLPLLEAAYHEAKRCNSPALLGSKLWEVRAWEAAVKGQAGCLEAILGWFGKEFWLDTVARAAANEGHLECLRVAQR
jgi:hypothetical protein